MAKLSEKYEAVVVFSLKNGEDAVKALVAKFSDLIKEHGTLVDVDEWGARKLAYEINYETDGYYVVYSFDCKPDGIRVYHQHYRRRYPFARNGTQVILFGEVYRRDACTIR